jgi:hypothetical protein
LHFAVAPVGSVLLAVAVGANFGTVADLAAAGAAAAGAAAAGAAAGVDAGAVAAGGADTGTVAGVAAAEALLLGAFCTPPWPLHAPRPVAAEVVPSLQVVAAVSSAAKAGSDNANTIRGAAINAKNLVFFMKDYSQVFYSAQREL